jgi:hypothetical protein
MRASESLAVLAGWLADVLLLRNEPQHAGSYATTIVWRGLPVRRPHSVLKVMTAQVRQQAHARCCCLCIPGMTQLLKGVGPAMCLAGRAGREGRAPLPRASMALCLCGLQVRQLLNRARLRCCWQ